MTILTKQIKPKRLNDKAFIEEFEKAALAISKEVEKELLKPTKTWKTKVNFERLVSVGPTSIDMLVATDNEIYGYLNDGTKGGYKIPKTLGGKRLAFIWGGKGSYYSKTQPNNFQTTGPGRATGTLRRPYQITHPGIKARNWSELTAKKFTKIYKRALEDALKKGVARSGHAMK